MLTAKKSLKLGKSYLKSLQNPLPLWAHLWVTDKCNLNCDYCYVVNNNSVDPSTKKVKAWIEHADKLGSAIIAFKGGEPILRRDLSELIAFANNKGIMTYLTSNGKLLNYDKLVELAKAGLDVLEISLDGIDKVKSSKKVLSENVKLIDLLEKVRDEFGLKFKIHCVLTPQNQKEISKLLELSKNKRIPISFGMLYNFYNETTEEEKKQLKKIIRVIMQNKKKNNLVINPTEYFEHCLTSLEMYDAIECDVGKYMIQVSTKGKVYVCSKLEEETDINFLDINKNYFKEGKHNTEDLLLRCSHNCLSACAYSSYYFRKHPKEFLNAVLKN